MTQSAGLTQLDRVVVEVEILLSGFVLLGLCQEALVVAVVLFDQLVGAQAAGISACFSPGDDMSYSTRIKVSYFELPLYP